MGCLRGKNQCKPKEAEVRCGKCGALAQKKSKVCMPEELAAAEENEEGKKRNPKDADKTEKSLRKKHGEDRTGEHHAKLPDDSHDGNAEKKCKKHREEKKCKHKKEDKKHNRHDDRGNTAGQGRVAMPDEAEEAALGAEAVLLKSLSVPDGKKKRK